MRLLSDLTLLDKLRRWFCDRRGHRWAHECDGLKRHCPRCGREDWVMGRLHPMIGEAAYYWKTMW